MQKDVYLRLNTVTSAVNITKLNETTKCDVIFSQGKFVVDGASVLGLFSLNLISDIKASITGTEEDIKGLLEGYKKNGAIVISDMVKEEKGKKH